MHDNHDMKTPAPEDKKIYGLLAEFADTGTLIEAAEQVREAGYRKWDVHTPFPVHGMDRAMGMRGTILPWIVLGGGLTGLAVALGLQWFTNAFDYPFLVSGKPPFSLPAFIPVTFELTVLLSAIAAVAGMLVLNLLPELYHPLFTSERFRRATDDRFFIAIEASDPQFDLEQTASFLRRLRAESVETVEA